MDQPTSETAAAIAKKRRNRAIYSCAECRRRKIACSKAYPRPCSTCVRLSKTCVYLPAPRATPKTTSSSGDGSSSSPSASIETESTTFTQPLQDGRKSSLTAQSTDWCISPSTGDLTDICLRVGRLIISERLGGLSRIDTLEGLNVMEQGVSTRMDVDVSSMHKTMSAPVVAWFKPLPMTNLLSPPLSKGDPKDEYFPSRTECDQLLDHYFAAIDPVVHLVYRPYIKQDVDELYERNPARTTSSSKSLILAMCFTSASSLSHIQTQQLLNIRKAKLVEKLKIATEASLQRADVLALNWTDYKLLQAILIYLTPFCCGEVARATSVFIGALIRAAEIAGFDIEPKVTISNIERQMRRHMWYYITYLDLRTGEAQGPTPTLASRDFDIQLPYDVNDSELVSDTIPTQPQGTFRFTDSTFSLMRWHSYNLHRYLTISRINSRRGTASIPEIIANANVQKDWIKATFVNHFDDRIPIQRYAKLAGNLLVERLDTMLFYDGFLKQHATSLRPKVVTSCIDVAEQAVLMESDPELAIWEWSFGQFHQHQSIFWLISQYYQEPDLPERDRIMFVADHVFGSGPGDHNRCIEIMDAIKHQLNGFLRARGFAYRPANEAEKPLPDSATIAASSIGSDESPDDSASWDNWMLAPVSEDLSGGYGQGNWWLVPQAYADPNPANIYMDPSKEIQ